MAYRMDKAVPLEFGLRPLPQEGQRRAEVCCLHELFEAQVDLRGDAPAIVCGDATLTYVEAEERSNRLAHFLRRFGVGPGTFVGLSFDRSELPIIAILACLKAGAAYVPIDPAYPDDRIGYIVEESGITVLLTEQSLEDRISKAFARQIIAVDACAAELATCSTARLSRAETGLSPDDLCYVIYTSGTTGRPKGVMTEHRNASRFVTAFNEVCRTTSEDRIYQGFSLSFDGSVEEIWMAFSNGAVLVVGTKQAPRFGNDLARYLTESGISYFSTVPTMLSTMTENVPSLRQLVVSGEACPPELVARWAQPGRLMLNVYGPTEATVNTTAAVCERDRPITIGRPLRGYDVSILDAEMKPVPHGNQGELYIGGIGVSRGYLNQPELTERSFVMSPRNGRRLYRTGDLVRLNDSEEIECFGRIDNQVKIRGFRVELSEIETVLLEQPQIVSVSVQRYDRESGPCLAAYVVLKEPSAGLDRGRILEALRARLPAYMVPAYLDVVETLPMLTSGKVDRKQLPAPKMPLVDDTSSFTAPTNALEAKIAEVWAALFGVPKVGVEQDFFLDLGGHSLVAAQLVAALREKANIHISVRDVYGNPTVRKMAAHVAALQNPEATANAASEQKTRAAALPCVRRRPNAWLTAAQVAFLLIMGPILALPLVIVLPPVIDMLYFRQPIVEVVIFVTLVGLALWPLLATVAIASKWAIIGRYKPGVYPLWGTYYARWWLVTRLQAISGLGAFGGTPLAPFMWRIMGAKVGRNCMLQTGLVSAWDCVTIGDDTSIGADTQIPAMRVENGHLIIGTVEIGNRCFIGCHSALGLDVRMADEARLDDQSLLPDGETIAAGEGRRGSPAFKDEVIVPAGEPIGRSRTYLSLFCALQVAVILLLGLALAAPFIAVAIGAALMIVHLSAAIWAPTFILGVPFFIVFDCLFMVALKRLIHPRPRAGTYALYSLPYLQFWMSSGLMRAVLAGGFLIFTTVYLPFWIRLLGAKLGRHTEMSTVWSFFPDMVTAGDGVFFADGCILGASRTHLGRFQMLPVTIGNCSFIGNSAMVTPGSGLGDNCLLGVLSAPPKAMERTPDRTDWLGSPGFQLPNRHKVGGFDVSTTYQPTRKLYLQRAVVDALRILVPRYFGLVLGVAGFLMVLAIYNSHGVWAVYAAAPFIGWAFLALAVAFVVGLKWAVMGRFRPVIVPLWSYYVWFNEMLNGSYEVVMAPVIALFYGTPFAAPLLRLIGCKIGRYCYIGTNLFSEFDLVEIGDYVALNSGVVIQNHLFEDRIMKSSYLKIDDGCSVGNMSVVLYDTHMEHDAVLGPLSLLMKGEIMPAGSRWNGIPTTGDNVKARSVGLEKPHVLAAAE